MYKSKTRIWKPKVKIPELPIEKWYQIALSTDYPSLLNLCKVSRQFFSICNDQGFWKDKLKLDFPKYLIWTNKFPAKFVYSKVYIFGGLIEAFASVLMEPLIIRSRYDIIEYNLTDEARKIVAFYLILIIDKLMSRTGKKYNQLLETLTIDNLYQVFGDNLIVLQVKEDLNLIKSGKALPNELTVSLGNALGVLLEFANESTMILALLLHSFISEIKSQIDDSELGSEIDREDIEQVVSSLSKIWN